VVVHFFGTTRHELITCLLCDFVRYAMTSFKDLDAFQACHQLTLAAHRIGGKIGEHNTHLASRLQAAAIVAASRIARGSGFRNPRMFSQCVDRTAAALAEFAAYLELAHELEYLPADDHHELETLGGRALFYVMKLAMSLEAPAPPPNG
jgi:four helix bundle protein